MWLVIDVYIRHIRGCSLCSRFARIFWGSTGFNALKTIQWSHSITFIPKQLQEAFRFTDRIWQNPKYSETIGSGNVRQIIEEAVTLFNRDSPEKKLNLNYHENVDTFVRAKLPELQTILPNQTEQQIREYFYETLHAIFFQGLHGKNNGDIVQCDIALIKNTDEVGGTLPLILHELTHALDFGSAVEIFEHALSIEGEVSLKGLSDIDLQDGLNQVYSQV